MKKVLLVILILMACVSGKAYADEKLVEINNKTCPVSHEEIGKGGMAPYQVTHKGKVYNLCCSMCEADFNKDPEKYIKMMEEEAANSKKM
jgi:YHS domain-containing protein